MCIVNIICTTCTDVGVPHIVVFLISTKRRLQVYRLTVCRKSDNSYLKTAYRCTPATSTFVVLRSTAMYYYQQEYFFTSMLTSKKDKETIPCPKCKHDMSKLSEMGGWWQCEDCGNVLTEKFS